LATCSGLKLTEEPEAVAVHVGENSSL